MSDARTQDRYLQDRYLSLQRLRLDQPPVRGYLLYQLPVLDAQTRLITGRRLEYRVTEKV
jgi:hypothetical protein